MAITLLYQTLRQSSVMRREPHFSCILQILFFSLFLFSFPCLAFTFYFGWAFFLKATKNPSMNPFLMGHFNLTFRGCYNQYLSLYLPMLLKNMDFSIMATRVAGMDTVAQPWSGDVRGQKFNCKMKNLPQSQCFTLYWELFFSFSGGWPLRLDSGLLKLNQSGLSPCFLKPNVLWRLIKNKCCCLNKHNVSHRGLHFFPDVFFKWWFDNQIYDLKAYFMLGDQLGDNHGFPLPHASISSQFHGHASFTRWRFSSSSLPLSSDDNCLVEVLISSSLDGQQPSDSVSKFSYL